MLFHVLSFYFMPCNTPFSPSLGASPRPISVVFLAVRTGPHAGRRIRVAPGDVLDGALLGVRPGPCLKILANPVAPQGAVVAAGSEPVSIEGRRTEESVALHLGLWVQVGPVRLEVVGPTAPPRTLVVGPDGRRVLHRPPPIPGPSPLAGLTPPTDPQTPTAPSGIGLLALAGPILTGVVMAKVAGGRAAAFAVAGAAVALLTYVATRLIAWRRAARVRRLTDEHRARFLAELEAASAADLAAREFAHPPRHRIGDLALAVDRRLWARRGGHPNELCVRIGDRDHDFVAPIIGAIGVVAASALASHRRGSAAPAVVDLHHSVGIAGPHPLARGLARGILLDAAALHGPADLRLAVVRASADGAAWSWVARLPHAQGETGTMVTTSLAALLDQLGTADGTPIDTIPPLVVVLETPVASDAERSALRALSNGRYGPASIVAVVEDVTELGSWCATVIELVDHERATIRVADGTCFTTRVSGCTAELAEQVADALADLRDPESASGTSLADSCRLVDLLGLGDGDGAPTDTSWSEVISRRWSEGAGTPELVVPLGVDERGSLAIDLVRDGPHALVAGTTGAGKSELLRSLVASIAATTDPEHAALVLIDYKGGSAFDGCALLPHVVGIVTDLDDGLAERALTCLEAEVTFRERLLRRHGATDLSAYRAARRLDPRLDPLPRLVVVVDEFATLVAELPDFVASLVDVAQRGRSLGIHLVLATQRPAGAVSDAMRTNIGLRIALRVVDVADSRDVIGATDAASISRRTPGRAIARLGPGELLTLQTARITGHAPGAAHGATGTDGTAGPEGAAAANGERPTDLYRLVDAVIIAHRRAGFAPPRRPWPEPLPTSIDLAAMAPPAPRDRSGDPHRRRGLAPLLIGLADEPRAQRQRPWTWTPTDGPLLVEGLPGSGVSTTLTTIALAATAAEPPDALHLYAFDGPGVPLAALAHLPHCGAVIAPDDDDRRIRLLHRLADERARRAAATQVGDDDAPSIVVLVDHIASLRLELDDALDPALLDEFDRLVAEGAPLGMHVVIGADRPAGAGHRLDATLAHRLTMHLPDPHRRAPTAGRAAPLIPGRGRDSTGLEVQVALPCAHGMVGAASRIARHWNLTPSTPTGRDLPGAAATVPSMPTLVLPETLPPPTTHRANETRVALGLHQRDLSPAWVTLQAGDHLLVAGPGRSGKSSVIAGLGQQWPTHQRIVVAGPRSPLPRILDGHAVVVASVRDLAMHIVERSDPFVVLVDDADLVDEGGPLDLLLGACLPGQHIIASGRPDRLRGLFRHWTTEVRRSRLGVLLRPEEGDADLLGVRLSPRHIPSRVVGRGVLVTDRGWTMGQAVTTAPDQ
jgi:S-DNA-T family DNA segregation ATPase FtsK/SpoIIIE